MTVAIETRDISSELEADIAKFERMLASYLDGQMDEDQFRLFRLGNGIYGQRQGGRAQMVRIKAPYGSITPAQLEALAEISDGYSRGWGHLTTRQNIQFHFVELERVPQLLRDLAKVGLTTREACGDTVRNITGCHLAGACPFEVLDISPWAEAAFRHFLHHPYAQRLATQVQDQLLGLRHGLRSGHVQRRRGRSGCPAAPGRQHRSRFPGLRGRRARCQPPPRPGSRGVHAPGGAAGYARSGPADLRPLREPGQQAPRPSEVAGGHDGDRRAARADPEGTQAAPRFEHLAGRHSRRSSRARRCPCGRGRRPAPTPVGTPVTLRLRPGDPYKRWETANVVIGVAKGTVSAIAYARLGDITSNQFRELASIQRDLGASVRVTNRQNLAFRDLTGDQLRVLYSRLEAIGMAEPGAELARDVVSCPGADTCNLAVTQSRGLADDIGIALEKAGLADVGGVRINISGCTNSCGQHHIADIGFNGAERRAHGRPAPGYQLLLGGHVGKTEIEFGQRAMRLPAKACAEATVRVVGRFAEEREPGEDFTGWLARAGGPKAIARRARRPRRMAVARGTARLLHRLRRDGALRGRSRCWRVRRCMSAGRCQERYSSDFA